MIRKFLRIIGDVYSRKVYRMAQQRAIKEYFTNIPDSQLPELTDKEIMLISEKWGNIIPNPKAGFRIYRVFKKFKGFNADYVPDTFFYPYIIRSLNPTSEFYSLTHKGLIDTIFSNIEKPKTIAKRIGDNLFDTDDSQNTIKGIAEILTNYPGRIIIKPAKGSNSGRGIRLLNPHEHNIKQMEALLAEYGDFVAQEVVEQSEFTAKFNPSSLNTIRVATLFINNRLSKCFALIKFGKAGSIVDNMAQGGIWVGIDEDGYLSENGYNNRSEVFKSHGGIKFKGERIPDFQRILDTAYKAHRKVATVGFVGWDIALKKNGTPLLIEANMWWPGITWGQMCNGPAFGNRLDEVIAYVSHHPAKRLNIIPSI